MTDREHKQAIEAAADALNAAVQAAHRDGLQVSVGITDGARDLRTGISAKSVITHTVRPVV